MTRFLPPLERPQSRPEIEWSHTEFESVAKLGGFTARVRRLPNAGRTRDWASKVTPGELEEQGHYTFDAARLSAERRLRRRVEHAKVEKEEPT